MAVFAFPDITGTTLTDFDPAVDTIVFPPGAFPSQLQLVASGSDTVVTHTAGSVTLAGLLPDAFDGLQFIFSSGIYRRGSAGDDAIEGSASWDVFDLTQGGGDTVEGGADSDLLRLGDTLDAADSISGGAGSDVVYLWGTYATTLELGATTMVGIERVEFGAGHVRLAIHENLLATATPSIFDRQALFFDGTRQGEGDSLFIDATSVTGTLYVRGGAGNDTLQGGTGDDFLEAGRGANLLSGQDGDDALIATGDSTLIGGDGDDELVARNGGSSRLYGGAGHDKLDATGSTGAVILHGGSGSDRLYGGFSDDLLYSAGAEDVDGDFVVESEVSHNQIYAGDGNDTLRGDAGLDWMEGEDGDDLLEAAGGADHLWGGDGSDTLRGGDGNDLLDGGAGIDVLEGGAGDDTYHVQAELDLIVEEAEGGVDKVLVHGTSYTLSAFVEDASLDPLGDGEESGATGFMLVGNGQANRLSATEGRDTLVGGGGDDVLDGGLGADRLEGGAGDDFYLVTEGDTVVESAGGGTDTVVVSAALYALDANVEIVEITWEFGELIGNALDNRLVARSMCTLSGGAGNDTLVGAGITTLRGGAGDDTYIVHGQQDRVEESASAGGHDMVFSAHGYTLGAYLEDLTLTGSTGQEANGNSLDNLLVGNAANNTFVGEAGADTMRGGLGDDHYTVQDAGDVVVEQSSAGTDTVSASINYVLGANVENLVLFGSARDPLSGRGNALDNELTGHAGDNVLNGAGGNDTMRGQEGNDTYVVDSAGDVVIEESWLDRRDCVRSSVSLALGENLEVLVLTGAGSINGTGNGANNEITGNGANNRLVGGGGNDTLAGGAGADTLKGGRGSDRYYKDDAGDVITEVNDAGHDLVISLVSHTLGAYQEDLTLTGSAAADARGNSQSNHLRGNAGRNLLDGGGGADTMAGGSGNDTYVVNHRLDVVNESGLAGGTDTVLSSVSFKLELHLEHLTLTGSNAINGIGNALDNRLTGNDGANVLIAGSGADTVAGGRGDDTYWLDALDIAEEQSGGGVDTVCAESSHALGRNFENLVLVGSGAVFAIGNDLANHLQGNAADNRLDGKAGADSMEGGRGNDTYLVDHRGDVIVEASGGGRDKVQASVSHVLGVAVEDLQLTGSALRGTGNGAANLLSGNHHGNRLEGRAGDDRLEGRGGDDTLVGGTGRDRLTGGAGRDLFAFGAGGDSTVAGPDRIADFVRSEDRIDLSTLDGNPGSAGVQDLRFIGREAFTFGADPGQLRFEARSGGVMVLANLDLDVEAEFALWVAGVSQLELGDFVL